MGLRYDHIGPQVSYDDAFALVKALSQDATSATYRVLYGHRWDQQHLMLADLIDRLGQLGGIIAKTNGYKPGKVTPYPRPKPLTRGAGTDSRRRGDAVPLDEVLAWAASSERTSDHGQEEEQG